MTIPMPGPRLSRTINLMHAEAFQLMCYQPRLPDERTTKLTPGGGVALHGPRPDIDKSGTPLVIWNSRDGVTPFIAHLDGVEYQHDDGGFQREFTAIIPDRATHVWVSYDRAAWRQMLVARWERFSSPLHPAQWDFAKRYPEVEAWLVANPFEPGQPRLITRAEFLSGTPEWMGKHQ
jgi:hypothetical protein